MPSGSALMRRTSGESSHARDVAQSTNMSVASSPQNRSPSSSKVGTPNTPCAIAWSVFARSASFTGCASTAVTPSGKPTASHSAAKPSGVDTSWPSRQMCRKIRRIASGVSPIAIARRSGRIGLNGCAGGIRNGMPSLSARYCAWR